MQPFEKQEIIDYSELLLSSFARMTGQTLLTSEENLARRLYEAPFALVSHGMQDDPIFCYGNNADLKLWKMTWDEFTSMPSRLTAEPAVQKEREYLLQEARQKGYITNYKGVRIAKDGQRFVIRETVLWNVVDLQNRQHGQACLIGRWDFLPSQEYQNH